VTVYGIVEPNLMSESRSDVKFNLNHSEFVAWDFQCFQNLIMLLYYKLYVCRDSFKLIL